MGEFEEYIWSDPELSRGIRVPLAGSEEFSSWAGYLYQGEVWVAQDQLLFISGMNPRYRFNSARWLLLRAEGIAASVMMDFLSGPQPRGDAANDAFDAMFRELELDPESWLRETDLYRALTQGLEPVSVDSQPKLSAKFKARKVLHSMVEALPWT